MNKVMALMRLDFITVKPYLTGKQLIGFACIALFMLTSNGSTGGAVMPMVVAALYASYPFVISEKSNMDVLYTTLSIKRNTVVLGRYLFAFTLDIFAGLFAFVFSFIVMTVMQKSYDAIDSLPTILILFLVFSVIQAAQFPIYFKLGYTKAKFLAYLPFIVLPVAVFVGSNFFTGIFSLEQIEAYFGWLATNIPIVALVIGVIWFALITISYKASVSFYRKREF